MADKKSEVYITVNHQQAETAIKQLKKSLASLTQQHNQLVAAGKEGSKRAKNLWAQMQDLSAVIKENETNLKLVGNVMNNLSGSTLSQLNRALKNVKKEMNRVSGDNDRLEQLHAQYRAINEQIRIMKGEMVNIAKHIQNLSAVSDDWLSKAISQQKTLVATLRQGTPEYIKQLNALRTLNAEQVTRAQSAIASGNASAESLRTSRATLTAYRDNIGTGAIFDLGSAKANTQEIERINEVLTQIDAQLNSIQGKNAEITKSVAEVAQQAEKIKLDPNSFSPKEIKAAIDDINNKLKEMGINDPMRTTLKKSATELQKILDGVDNELIDIKKLLEPQNLKSASLEKLKKAASQLEKEIEKMDRNMGDFTKRQNELQRIREEINKTTGEVNKQASAWKTTFRNISMYFGVFQLFSIAQQKLQAVLHGNLQFSDQLADVRKVTGLATKDIWELSDAIANIDSRSSLEGLMDLAYQGGKMGFGKYGVEGLQQFVRAADQVKVALSDDLGDDSLLQIAKLTDTMGLIPRLGVEKAMLSVGSAINQLAATSTASGTKIVDFAKRLTGLSRITGITTPELLALGSAADALGQAPEVAATAFGKLFTSIQNNHNLIEKSLGMEKGVINNLFSQGKAMEAILQIMEKMKEKGNMNALGNIWKDLGSEGQRLIGVMATMSKNVDTVRAHVLEANTAFDEATSLTNEYALKQNTANAILEKANNLWEKAFVSTEGVDVVKELARQWYELSQSMTSNRVSMMAMKGLFAMIAWEVRILIKLLPALLLGLMFKGASAAVIGVAKSIGLMGDNAVIATLKTKGLTAAWKELNAVQKANVIALVISTLASLAIVLGDVISQGKKTTVWMQGFNTTMADFNREFAIGVDKLDQFKKAIEEAAVGTKQRQAAITNFNREYGQYLTKMLNEKSTANDLAEAYKEVVKQLRAKIALQLRNRDIEKEVSPRIGWAADRLTEYDQEASGTAYNSTWLKGYVDDMREAGKSVEEISRDLAKKLGVNSEIAQDAYKMRGRQSPTEWFDVEGYRQQGGIGGYEDPVAAQDARKRNTRKLTQKERMLYAANRYAAQMYSADNARIRVNKKYEPFKEDLDRATTQEESLGTLENEAPDKDAAKAAADALRKQKKEWRDQLKQSQDEAKAIIDNIKNFYQRQITEVLRTANEQNWDTTLTESAVRAVEGRMNLALSQARKGIAGIENTWDDFKKTMTEDMREQADEVGYNESQVLLDDIQKNNLDALREKMSDLAKNLNMPETAVTDAIWKNATLNEKANETAEQKHRKAINARLLEDNYTGKVDDEYTQSMETLGFFDIDESQLSTLMGGDEAKIKNLLDKRANDIASLLTNARENIVDIYNVDLSAEDGGKNQLLTILFGPDWMDTNTELKAVLKMDANEMKVFYDELLKYSDAYTEAQKKVRDRQKRLIDFKWSKSAEYNTVTTAQDNNAVQASKVGQHAANAEKPAPRNDVYGTGAFISSMGEDPEVEAYRLKMEAAAAYYEFLAKHGADAQTLREQERAVLQSEMEYAQSVANQMRQRIDDIYALADPVESFGSAMGKAFATMTEDAEAGRAAIRAAIGDMINGFMEQTVKMTEEFIKRRLMQEMNDRLTSEEMRATAEEQKGIEQEKQSDINAAQQEGQSEKTSIFKKLGRSFTKLFKKQSKQEITAEEKKQDEILDVQETGGEAQEILNVDVKNDIQDATEQIGSQTLATQQAQTTQEVATESAKTQANTVMGIASGAAKIIGSLGWWGIPLVAVITALLNGLLAFAMGKVSSLFGGGSDSGSDSGPATKLVTGMLTYDAGNVQSFDAPDGTRNPNRPKNAATPTRSSDNEPRPVLGADGQVYNAREAGELQTGLVTEPITTLVNGQPAIVGEKGPEMVIGRETTEALQMARPDIIRDIIKFDKNFSGRGFRVFDSGNVGDLDLGDGNTAQGLTSEDIDRLNSTISNLGMVLTLLQKNGIPAHINKYGRGGVTNEAASGADFMKTFSGDPLWKRG